LRTARGAGRLDLVDRAFAVRRAVLFGAFLPDRLPDERVVDVRDAGGEDVRVAMVPNLRDRHTSHRHTTPDVGWTTRRRARLRPRRPPG
jgi:hypothetical protein